MNRDDLPPDSIDAYNAGRKLALDGGWLDDLPLAEPTREGLIRIIAKQIGFIDGLKELKRRSTEGTDGH